MKYFTEVIEHPMKTIYENGDAEKPISIRKVGQHDEGTGCSCGFDRTICYKQVEGKRCFEQCVACKEIIEVQEGLFK